MWRRGLIPMNHSESPTIQAPAPLIRWRPPALYGFMVVVAVGLFFLIRSWGDALPLPQAAPPASAAAPRPAGDAILHILLALAAVIFVGRLLGRIFTYIGQPPVIGEVVAGI